MLSCHILHDPPKMIRRDHVAHRAITQSGRVADRALGHAPRGLLNLVGWLAPWMPRSGVYVDANLFWGKVEWDLLLMKKIQARVFGFCFFVASLFPWLFRMESTVAHLGGPSLWEMTGGPKDR